MTAGIARYFETDGYGRKLRTAYALQEVKLPAAVDGAAWRPDDTFDRANALLDDPGLKTVFAEVLKQGFAIVQT